MADLLPGDPGRAAAASASGESSREMHPALEMGPALLWTTGPDGALTYVNRRWTECTGQPPQEALGQGWLEAVHPEDRPHAGQVLTAAHVRS